MAQLSNIGHLEVPNILYDKIVPSGVKQTSFDSSNFLQVNDGCIPKS